MQWKQEPCMLGCALHRKNLGSRHNDIAEVVALPHQHDVKEGHGGNRALRAQSNTTHTWPGP